MSYLLFVVINYNLKKYDFFKKVEKLFTILQIENGNYEKFHTTLKLINFLSQYFNSVVLIINNYQFCFKFIIIIDFFIQKIVC